MKKIIYICKFIVVLTFMLQSNFISASITNNSELQKLGTDIAKSEVGKNFFFHTLAYNFITGSYQLSLNDNEMQLRNEKLIQFKTNTNYENLALNAKDEFASLMGFKSFESLKKLTDECYESRKKLFFTFQTLNTLSADDIETVIAIANEKINIKDLFKAYSCLGNATSFYAACLGIPGGFTALVFAGCVGAAVASEAYLTAGAVSAVMIQALTVDAVTCRWIVAVGSGTIAPACTTEFGNKLINCF